MFGFISLAEMRVHRQIVPHRVFPPFILGFEIGKSVSEIQNKNVHGV